MKLLFISSLYPKEYIELLRLDAQGLLQNAPNVFQWAVLEGLLCCEADFEVVCLPALPAYPMRYNQLYTPKGDVVVNGKVLGKMLSYCDLVVYKTISQQHCIQQYIEKWIEKNKPSGEQLVVLTYTPYVPYIKAVRKVKYKNPQVKVAAIVTDLVDDMLNFASNRGLLKRIQTELELRQTKRLYRYIDKFILLSHAMEEKIPEAVGHSIVVEGLSSITGQLKPVKKNEKVRTLLYTGTFEEFAGVKELVESFMLTNNPNFRLQLCGKGELVGYIKEQNLKDSRIQYVGLVSRDEAVRLQREATLLVNPRKPSGGITRYSFPSKTMEYLSSGTPMIGYKLEGIPVEYYQHIYTTDDLSISAMAMLIDATLSLSQSTLDEKAANAYMFILNNKTAEIQVGRILDFLKL